MALHLASGPRTSRPFSRESFTKKLFVVGLFMIADLSFNALAADPGSVVVKEADSSNSTINALKGSSVWLHWAYDYGGDTRSNVYKEQVIEYKSASQATIQPLAKRIGANGILTLESSIPAPFNGRVAVISANSTLVINNLQYNDSSYQFGSYIIVEVDIGGGPALIKIQLKPNVNITVQGVPEFTLSPPPKLDVNENSNLKLRVEMDGNPRPSADFKWLHLSGSTNVPSVQVYPFIYSSTYSLNNIDASFCGRILQTTIKNINGSSAPKDTNVTVLLKLDKPFDIKAGKLAKDRCVEVKWNKAESGACYVKYEVKFKNVSGNYLYNETGYNIAEMRKCNLPTFVNITEIQLTATFKSTSKTFTIKVSENPIVPPTTPSTQKPETTKPSTTQNGFSSSSSSNTGSPGNPTSSSIKVTDSPESGPSIGLIVGASFGGLIFLIIVIVVVLYCVKRSKRRKGDQDSGEPDYPLQENAENQYAVAGDMRKPPEPTYADPNKSTLIYGKLADRGERPRQARKEDISDYADVKVDEFGYPAVGAMPTSYTDGYGEKGRSRGDSGRDSGRRVAPDRRPPPPYNDSGRLDDDGYPVSRNPPPVYAQVDKSRKHR